MRIISLIFILTLQLTTFSQTEQPPQVCVHIDDSTDLSIQSEIDKIAVLADEYFQDHQCDKSTELYNRLLQLDHKYDSIATARIDFCKYEAQEFFTILSHADQFFRNQEYPRALSFYQRAEALWPGDKYVLQMIETCKALRKSISSE